ncbi:serine hydrolase, partial [bacterium]|nr:serine hydrolase [bacterium]
KYPKQMTMGALTDNTYIKHFARDVAEQMQVLGVNVSFSPVVDINSNPQNPVIHMRSFGESKYDVADKALQYLAGLQENGILAVAKHFPGHGDTHTDSHLDLPLINHSRRRLNKVELYPFERLFEGGVGGVMTAHLHIPAFVGTQNLPASLSPKITDKLLRRSLDFGGLVFSDALNMQGVTKYVPASKIDIKAFEAGNDILLFPAQVEETSAQLKKAIEAGEIDEEILNEKVLRILRTKLWLNKDKTPDKKLLSAGELYEKLNEPKYELAKRQIAENALTRLGRKRSSQLKDLHDTLLCIKFGNSSPSPFEEYLNYYRPVKTLSIALDSNHLPEIDLNQLTKKYNNTVVALMGVNPYRVKENFGYSKPVTQYISNILDNNDEAILVNFGTPYLLNGFDVENPVFQAYEEMPEMQIAAAQALFGAIGTSGLLPVSCSYQFGDGETEKARNLLSYGVAEQVGLSSKNLKRIDKIALNAIAEEATPGCQILVAKDGKVVYQKSFGTFTYAKSAKVSNNKLYDVASMTKVMASTMMLMRYYEMGAIDLDKTLYDYLGNTVDSSKMDLSLREILTHQSGLSAWIPFYKYTLTEGGMCDSNYCYEPNTFFSVKVADSLYVQRGIRDTIYNMINRSKMKVRGKYLYSDLGYFYMLQILENLTNSGFENYLYQNFYYPMGMNHTMYNPLNVYKKTNIVPTEDDNYFRHQLIHGYVHDPAAAMLGGVAGHAGIFSTANDVAKLFQMLLQKGSYNEINYFEPATIELFTSKQYAENRKGIGFDKPETRPGVPSPVNSDCSPGTFGHTGFTGTCVWADPQYNLLYVFLSNRVNPSAENMKLIRMNVRTDILQVVYDDLLNKIPE